MRGVMKAFRLQNGCGGVVEVFGWGVTSLVGVMAWMGRGVFGSWCAFISTSLGAGFVGWTEPGIFGSAAASMSVPLLEGGCVVCVLVGVLL